MIKAASCYECMYNCKGHCVIEKKHIYNVKVCNSFKSRNQRFVHHDYSKHSEILSEFRWE